MRLVHLFHTAACTSYRPAEITWTCWRILKWLRLNLCLTNIVRDNLVFPFPNFVIFNGGFSFKLSLDVSKYSKSRPKKGTTYSYSLNFTSKIEKIQLHTRISNFLTYLSKSFFCWKCIKKVPEVIYSILCQCVRRVR